MSWLSITSEAMDAEEVFDSSPEVNMAGAIVKLCESRVKSIAKIEGEIKEYVAQRDVMAVGSPAYVALSAVISVKSQRMARLQVELEGFRAVLNAPDARQTEIPVVKVEK